MYIVEEITINGWERMPGSRCKTREEAERIREDFLFASSEAGQNYPPEELRVREVKMGRPKQ